MGKEHNHRVKEWEVGNHNKTESKNDLVKEEFSVYSVICLGEVGVSETKDGEQGTGQ